jgi:hypothetical protein
VGHCVVGGDVSTLDVDFDDGGESGGPDAVIAILAFCCPEVGGGQVAHLKKRSNSVPLLLHSW